VTTTAARPVDPEQADLLTLIADEWTTLGKPFADAFRDACWDDAIENAGTVNPNRVRKVLMKRNDYDPRQLSALWGSACSTKRGFLDKTDERVDIDPDGSKGNGNKDVLLRRWRTGVER